jgi:pimeloyl-[acyl-carrier protein] synthase
MDDAWRFDPHDPAFRLDPYPFYSRLRDDPVHWGLPPALGPDGAWYVSRADDIQAGLRDSSFVRELRNVAPERMISFPDEIMPFIALMRRMMLFRDPPDHTRLRRLVNRAFTPRTVAALEPSIQKIADELCADLTETTDLIAGYAFPLPVTVIAELLGVPDADRDKVRTWSAALVTAIDVRPNLDDLPAAVAAGMEMAGYLGDVVAARRAEPRDDLLSALVAAEEDGLQLTADEVIATAILLLIAGHETTVNLIANGMIALLRHPDQLETLRADRSLDAGAVEELLRYDSPVQLTGRFVAEDMTWGGRDLRRGENIVFLLGSGNRDPAATPDPDRLDVTRDPRPHLSFGGGIHFCVGAGLARAEARIALRTLIERFPTIELATDEITWRDMIAIRGPDELSVHLG